MNYDMVIKGRAFCYAYQYNMYDGIAKLGEILNENPDDDAAKAALFVIQCGSIDTDGHFMMPKTSDVMGSKAKLSYSVLFEGEAEWREKGDEWKEDGWELCAYKIPDIRSYNGATVEEWLFHGSERMFCDLSGECWVTEHLNEAFKGKVVRK